MLADVEHSKATGLATYLTIVVDDNSIGGKPKRMHVNHITQVAVLSTDQALESLLEGYAEEW